ncbi:hypothetical protein [Sphingomonas corticis]|jgi:hypothetical protein|uniref:Uncharacterized protein n=1 Tax=Sphingomonas corticis TaxID=2722791 RepID=A0ABX1CNT7_9SPHN|nr:hypothetical protein [Sphingomonas corticis]NJR78476.1 hypothetical protein [Sphingomonas corticis]
MDIGSLGGISRIAQLTPLGGIMSLASRNLVSALGQNLIQQLGSAIGLPQPLIDAAQGQFAFASGDVFGGISNLSEAADGFAQAAGGSFTDRADFSRDIQDNLQRMASDIAGGPEAREARAGGRGGSWLMAMARALGEKADMLADQMQGLADRMSSDKSDPSASLEFSAKSQEFGLFMNAASNALKTAGESLTTAARKGG